MPALALLQRNGCTPFKEDQSLSFGDPSCENMLFQGDNFAVLTALLPHFRGKVKCIYLDPPYNTRRRFANFSDTLNHRDWLSMMYPRLALMRDYLSDDGSIWISIDDNEAHYLKVMMDAIFGRSNFVANCVWHRSAGINAQTNYLSRSHEYVLVFAKNKKSWQPALLAKSEMTQARFRNPDNHPKGPWRADNLYCRLSSPRRSSEDFHHTFGNGVVWRPPNGYFSRFSSERLIEYEKNNEIWFGHDGKAVPSKKTFLAELKRDGVPAKTLWLHGDVGHTHEAKHELTKLSLPSIFDTPKPERLLKRIFHLSTKSGDLVLDAFLGSGTSAAVALKMGRRFIGIEIGEQAKTHCALRLKKVVEGEQGGISKAVNWNGGSGFKFFQWEKN